MARKCTGNPTGRPDKPIDWNMFEQLCGLQCTQDEMAGFLHVCGPTLSTRVAEHYGEDYLTVYKRFTSSGKCSLRRNQFVMSKKSASMAIWLGKQWLGQKDMSKEEMHDMVKEIKDAIKESEAGPGSFETQQPHLASEQPLLYQEFSRQTTQVPDELGPKGPIC
jgi:hypothetical protein